MTTPETNPGLYDVLMAFSEARTNAPNDRSILRSWTTRYPQFADDLITLDFAHAATGITLTPEGTRLEEAPEEADVIAMGRDYLKSRPSPAPLTSLIGEAAARGVDVPQLAKTLRLDRLLLSRLEQRALEAASIPISLVQQIAQILGRSTDEIAAYLRSRPRLASQTHYKAQRAPSLVAEAGMPRQSFAEALQRGQTMAADDRAYWQSEIEAGVLGNE